MGILGEKNEVTKEPLSFLEIIIIACFISLVFAPLGVILMWWKSKWAKKSKLILSLVFGILFLVLVSLLVALSIKSEGGNGSGSAHFGLEQEYGGSGESGKKSDAYKPRPSKGNKNHEVTSGNSSRTLAPSLSESFRKSRVPYIIFFIAIIIVCIIVRNMKGDAKKTSDNPYVNTSLYKIPVPENFVFPQVHYTKLPLYEEEKILFATSAEQKDNPGDIIVTDKRFVFLGKKGNLEFPLHELSAISSLSNTALLLTAGEKQHYFFVRDTQMRFVLQIVRWAFARYSEKEGHLGYGGKSDDFGLEENEE